MIMKKKMIQSTQEFINKINEVAAEHPEWLEIFNKNFLDTLENTVKLQDDATTYVLTGDIPAMWLRDSTAQIRPYLFLANESDEIKSLIKGLRSEEHTSELQSRFDLVCRLLLEKKKYKD